MRRWYCPVCGGGILGPTAPRANDARRWCLDCTRFDSPILRRCASAAEAKELDLAAIEREQAARTCRKTRRAHEAARKVAEALGAPKPEPRQKLRRCNITKAGPRSGYMYVCNRRLDHKGPHRSQNNGYDGRRYTWR